MEGPFEAVVYTRTEVDEREREGQRCLLVDKLKVSDLVSVLCDTTPVILRHQEPRDLT
jgi:hypothetical protein